MNNMGIYKITNKQNGRVYIGQSKNIKYRWSIHIRELEHNRHHAPLLQADYNSMSLSAFVFELIKNIDNEQELYCQEQIIIKSYINKGFQLYNVYGNQNSDFNPFEALRLKKLQKKETSLILAKTFVETTIKDYEGMILNKEQQKKLLALIFSNKDVQVVNDKRGGGLFTLNSLLTTLPLPYLVSSKTKKIKGKRTRFWTIEKIEE